MTTVLTLALPFSLLFMAISGETNWQGFVLGYIISVIVLQLGQAYNLKVNPLRAPLQVVYFLIYIVRLVWDIFVSSLEVAGMILSPNLEKQIDPGVLVISTQDDENNEIVTALSSHWITITPGQMVMDIEERNGETNMIIHNLNVERSRPTIEQEQTSRLKLIRKVLGYG